MFIKIIIILLISVPFLIAFTLFGYEVYLFNKEIDTYRFYNDEEIKILSDEVIKQVIGN